MAAPPIKISVQLQPVQASLAELRRAVGEAEDIGVDAIFNSDHFFPVYGPPDGPCFESWTLLAAWAEQTKRVELGVSVSGFVYRNPNLLADMARTVDHISGGRVILGLGWGWFMKDYDEYGFTFPPDETRLKDYVAALETIKDRLSRLNPPPLRKMPIFIGNGGADPKPHAMIARYADRWMDFKSPAMVKEYNLELDKQCRLVGRNPHEIERGVAIDDVKDLSKADAFHDAGCTHFMIRYIGPHFDLSDVPQWLRYRDQINGKK